MRPGKLFVQLVVKPLLGCMMLARRAGPVAACVMDAVVFATAVARREALSIGFAWAVLDGAEDLAV